MQSGWVIVYVPGGDIYQILDPYPGPTEKNSFKRRVIKRTIKTILTCAQLYWWLQPLVRT